MTDREWQDCADLDLLCLSIPLPSERKRRLFACTCCRRVWNSLTLTGQKAIETSEQYADGKISRSQLTRAYRKAGKVAEDVAFGAQMHMSGFTRSDISRSAYFASQPQALPIHELLRIAALVRTSSKLILKELRWQCDLAREIFGSPSTQTVDYASFSSRDAVAIAGSIYEEGAFNRLPILADALEDAGCTNADILNHCRQPGEHCRGCWVVDLLLDKR